MILAQPLLLDTYCVPDLQFDSFFANCYHFCSELDSNGNLMFLSEAVVNELE
jgi:hypothetical protein